MIQTDARVINGVEEHRIALDVLAVDAAIDAYHRAVSAFDEAEGPFAAKGRPEGAEAEEVERLRQAMEAAQEEMANTIEQAAAAKYRPINLRPAAMRMIPADSAQAEAAENRKSGPIAEAWKEVGGLAEADQFGTCEAIHMVGQTYFRYYALLFTVDELRVAKKPIPEDLLHRLKMADSADFLARNYLDAMIQGEAARLALKAIEQAGYIPRTLPRVIPERPTMYTNAPEDEEVDHAPA